MNNKFVFFKNNKLSILLLANLLFKIKNSKLGYKLIKIIVCIFLSKTITFNL